MNVWHFDSPKRPFLCSDLSKESSSVDRYQLRNIYCYIFLQLDNAMIYILYRKSWLKWVCRVYTWSTFEASVSPQKSARLAKNQQTSLKTLSCVLYKNTEKYRYLIFKNPGIGIWVQSRYTGIFRYTAGACSLVVSSLNGLFWCSRLFPQKLHFWNQMLLLGGCHFCFQCAFECIPSA